MKSSRMADHLHRFLRCAGLCLLVPMSVRAGEDPGGQGTEGELQLSPFTVRADRDSGFAAASSLAAGRLASDLRDSPAAFSVATREFIDALSLTDLQSTAAWMTSASEAPDNGQQLFFNNPVYYVVRGTRNSRQQRNYFPQFNDLDSYNLQRYDFGRGPNAILFGNGTLGGVSSATTVRPDPHAFSQRLSASYGSWQRARITTDTNLPVSSRAALRVDTLWSEARGWRDKDMERRRGAFLATLWRPFAGTELRLEAEYLTNARQVAFTNLADQLSGWDGVTTYHVPLALRTLPAGTQAKGVTRMSGIYDYNPYSGDDAILNMAYVPTTLAAGATSLTPAGGYTSGSGPSFSLAGSNILHEVGAPADRFARAVAGSSFRIPSESFALSPDTPLITQRFRDLQFALTQRLGRYTLELAADTNRAIAFVYGEQNRGLADTYIDINSVTPTGRGNTHFLQPYADAMAMRSYRGFNYDNLRAAVAAEWRPRGMRVTANLMGGVNLDRDDVDYQYLTMGMNADHRLWTNEYVLVRRYWNESSRPVPDLSSREVRYFNPSTGADMMVRPAWVPDIGRTDTEAVNHSNFKYALGSVNLRLLHDRLVLVGALRGDAYFFNSRQQLRPGDYPVAWDGRTVLFKPDAPPDYLSLKYQSRDSAGVAYGPLLEAINRPRSGINRDLRYLGERFKDDYNAPPIEGSKFTRNAGVVGHPLDWVSPFFNYSETFNPNTFTTRINGSLLAPTVASGIDYGLRLELLERRLDLRITRYANREVNGAISSDGPGYFNVLYDANVVGDQSTYGRNQRGIAPLPIQYRDTRTRTADGTEFELTFNPGRALRLTANLAFPRVYESDMNPDVRAYIAQNAELFRQIAADAGVIVDLATNFARVDTSIPLAQRSPDATAAAGAYNDIYNFLNGIVTGRRLNQDQPVFNLFGDYKVQEGRLRGLRLGLGARYRGRQIVGNKGSDTIVNPANPATAIDDPSVDASTPLYTPKGYIIMTSTLAYAWRLRQGGTLSVNLVVDNLLDDRGPIYSSTAQVASLMRPRNGDYSSPARVAVPRYYALKQPLSFNLGLTLAR